MRGEERKSNGPFPRKTLNTVIFFDGFLFSVLLLCCLVRVLLLGCWGAVLGACGGCLGVPAAWGSVGGWRRCRLPVGLGARGYASMLTHVLLPPPRTHTRSPQIPWPLLAAAVLQGRRRM